MGPGRRQRSGQGLGIRGGVWRELAKPFALTPSKVLGPHSVWQAAWTLPVSWKEESMDKEARKESTGSCIPPHQRSPFARTAAEGVGAHSPLSGLSPGLLRASPVPLGVVILLLNTNTSRYILSVSKRCFPASPHQSA